MLYESFFGPSFAVHVLRENPGEHIKTKRNRVFSDDCQKTELIGKLAKLLGLLWE